MKKITLFLFYISTFIVTVYAQTPGNFYVKLTGNASICTNGETRTLTADYNKQLPPSATNPIDDYYPPIAIFPSLVTESLTSSNKLVPVPNTNPDDFFSSVFTLPFQFRFYGINYNQLLVGSNGVLTFDTVNNEPGDFCPYFIGANGALADLEEMGPNTNFPVKNAICGVYQDIDFTALPTATTSINYFVKDTGAFAAPNRIFVLNYNNVELYAAGATDPIQTYQIVLYEGTNIIDINVLRRTQNNWVVANGGVLGIINADGSKAHLPNNHNTTEAWTTLFGATNTPESWRFIPKTIEQRTNNISAAPYDSKLQWFKNGFLLPDNTDQITVTAVENDEYQCKVVHDLPSGIQNTVSSAKLKFKIEQNPTGLEEPVFQNIFCEGSPIIIDQTNFILNGQNPAGFTIQYYQSQQDAIDIAPNNIANLSNFIPITGAPVNGQPFTTSVFVSISDNLNNCPPKVREIVYTKNITPSGTFDYGDTAASITDDFCLGATGAAGLRPVVNSTLTSGGSFYTNSPATNGITVNALTGEVNFTNAIAGPYTVFYKFPIVEGCTIVPDLAVVINVVSCGCQNTTFNICSSDTSFNLVAPVRPGAFSYQWDGPGPNGGLYTGNQQNPTGIPYPTGATSPFIYKVTVKDAAGNIICNNTEVSVVAIPKANSGTLTNLSHKYCDNNSQIPLSDLLTGEDSNGTWSIVGVAPADGTFLASSGTFTPSALPAGTAISIHKFKYSITGTAPCGNTSTDVEISIYNEARPGTLKANTITDFCETDVTPIPLFNFIENYDTRGVWTTTRTGGTLDSATGIYINALGATGGVFTYTVNGSPSPCPSTTVDVTLNFKKTPNSGTLTTGPNQYCDTSTTPIPLFDLINGEDLGGTWTRVGSQTDGSFIAADGTFTPSPISVASITSQFKYEVFNSPCASRSTTVSVTVLNSPSAGSANVGTNVACEIGSAPIILSSLLTAEDAGGTWQQVSGSGGTFFNPLNPLLASFTPTLGTTTSTFRYSVGISGCGVDSEDVSITINKIPNSGTATIGPNQYCDTSTTPIDLNTLLTGEDNGGTWTRVGSQTDGLFEASFERFTPGPLTTVSSSTSQFKYEVTNPPCNPSSTLVSLTVFNSPSAGTANAGTNLTCEIGSAPILLNTLLSGEDGGGSWQQVSGSGGSFFNPIDPTLASFTPSLGATTSTFRYTVGLVSCGLETEDVTITIKKAPSSGVASTNNNYCDNAGAIPLFDLLTNEDSNGTWSRGVGTYGIFDATLGKFTPTAMTSTTTNVVSFIYTVPGLPCSAATTTVTLNIDKSPNAGTINPSANVYCDSDATPIPLSILISGEDPGVWERLSGIGGIFDNFLGTFKLTSGTTTSTFKYTVGANTACPKDESIVTINVKAAANAGTTIAGGLVVCESDTTEYKLADLLDNEQSGGRWTRTGTGGSFDAIRGTYKAGVGATSGVFRYTIVGTSPCINDTEDIVLTINPAATPSFTQVAPICKNDALLPLPTTSNNGIVGTWSPSISNLVTTEYTFTPNAGSCSFIQKMTIQVNDLPKITLLPKEPFICVDITGLGTTTALLTTGLSSAIYNFKWTEASNPSTILGSGSDYTATVIGTYTVVAIHKLTLCENTANVKVVSSLPPNSMTFVTSNYFEDDKTITVTVSPPSVYEYQIDNGAFQDSNQFVVMTSGDHKIVVRDKFGCDQIEDTVYLLDYPKFFTPNGDGYNDYWTISDLKNNQTDTEIFIFDRFGKLMKQLTLASKGWDGTSNGIALPADDYWFTVNYEEGQIKKVFKSNFSLKR